MSPSAAGWSHDTEEDWTRLIGVRSSPIPGCGTTMSRLVQAVGRIQRAISSLLSRDGLGQSGSGPVTGHRPTLR
ncbi:hypothetical protein RRG08_022478 [Elysia crispata]|uniref:Uncharacterized protein n=1 Tax=Elysia crispata TaxID=231223 RepID=A0AAE0Z192_9GAST|nr:hypothetical protein RRG08_022478 [Elysia crispata]